MNISIVKMTPSKNRKDLMFLDIRLNDLGCLLKGIRAIKTNDKCKGGMTIALPTLNVELVASNENKQKWKPYTPFTFLSKETHNLFIEAVKSEVSKLLNTTESKK